jgi:hypothetical protein
MHASVRKYKVDEDQMDEVSRRAAETYVPRASAVSGFVAYYLVDAGHGILIAVNVADDAEAVEQLADVAAEFVRDDLSDLEIERVEAAHGEVRASQAA